MSSKGQSLLEVIIAVAVGTITVLAALTVLVLILRVGSQDASLQTAAFLGQQMIDDVTITAERDWQQIAMAGEGQNYHSATTTTAGVFQVVDGAEDKVVDGISYSTFFQVSSVLRDTNGQIASVGTDDPSTKKIDVFVTWPFRGETSASTISKYLTRSKNFVFWQTDWSGGPTSPSDPINASTPFKFLEASSTIDFSSQPGQVKLKIND